MKSPAEDTPPEIEARQIEGFRRMSPKEKLFRVQELNRTLLQLARVRILERYGRDLPEREVRLRLASLWLDRQIMIDAFGWDPVREGY